MNLHYFKRYLKFIDSVSASDTEQCHIHHIIPRSLGGTNEKSNLKKLTVRQHFIAHWMLAKAYNTGKMWSAFRVMCLRFKGCSRVTSKMYELSEKKRIENVVGLIANMVWVEDRWVTVQEYAEIKDKVTHHNAGKVTVREISTGNTLKVNVGFDSTKYESIKTGFVNAFDSVEGCYKEISKAEFKRFPERYSTANKGVVHCFLIDTGESITVSKEEFNRFNGIKYKHPTKGLKLKCPHCGKEGGNSLKRWHFDHCNKKGQ